MILVGFTSFLMVLISMVTVYLNFENSLVSEDITASKNGHYNFFQICYFTVASIIFAFFSSDEYVFMRMATLLVFGFVLLMSVHYDAPFYVITMQRF
jgi:hypothetical protein